MPTLFWCQIKSRTCCDVYLKLVSACILSFIGIECDRDIYIYFLDTLTLSASQLKDISTQDERRGDDILIRGISQ